MMLLQLISYLDRGNIGFAATQGMTKDIHLKGTNLNVCHLYYDVANSCLCADTLNNRQLSPSSTSSTFLQSSQVRSGSSAYSSTGFFPPSPWRGVLFASAPASSITLAPL
jgi:hypothetical protein